MENLKKIALNPYLIDINELRSTQQLSDKLEEFFLHPQANTLVIAADYKQSANRQDILYLIKSMVTDRKHAFKRKYQKNDPLKHIIFVI